MKRILLQAMSHGTALLLGFGIGIYLLPILTAPAAPSNEAVSLAAAGAGFSGEFRRGLKDSDLFHWGEGKVSVGREAVVFNGKLAPGPDYRLYLSPEFVETEADFLRLKPRMVQVGEVKTFENFVIPVPPTIDVAQYNSAIVWCESFGQFITSAKYR